MVSMVAHISVAEAQAWAEGTKLTISSLDQELEAHLAEETIRRLDSAFDVTLWVDAAGTPKLVRTIISKLYVAWLYDRTYSEDIEQGNNYADRLKINAEILMTGLLDGTIELPGLPDVAGSPVFYPTDASSAMQPTFDDPSLGPAAFSMGMRF
jgi:hypothetical protein